MAANYIATRQMCLLRESCTSGQCGTRRQRLIGPVPPIISRPGVRPGYSLELPIEICGFMKWDSLARPDGGGQQASAPTFPKDQQQGANPQWKRCEVEGYTSWAVAAAADFSWRSQRPHLFPWLAPVLAVKKCRPVRFPSAQPFRTRDSPWPQG